MHRTPFMRLRPLLTTLLLPIAGIGIAACSGPARRAEPMSKPNSDRPTAPAVAPSPPERSAAPLPEHSTEKPADHAIPATQPASTYEAASPYRVQLFVNSPEERQPGWLRIVEFEREHKPATAAGVFPSRTASRWRRTTSSNSTSIWGGCRSIRTNGSSCRSTARNRNLTGTWRSVAIEPAAQRRMGREARSELKTHTCRRPSRACSSTGSLP